MKTIPVNHFNAPLLILSFFLLISPVLSLAQFVSVGSGGYSTQLPPADAAGRNAAPIGTPRISGAAVSKPVVTSDWWTGLLSSSESNWYNYPLSLKAVATGLVMSYTFLGQGVEDSRQPMSPEQPILMGVKGLSVTYPTVSDYTDWTVTSSWEDGTHQFSATMGMGMPFVYFKKGSGDSAIVTITSGTVTVLNEMILVSNSISGSNFAVYAPSGSVWIKSGSTYSSSLSGKNYYSAALLPFGISALTAANEYKNYAYVFPANTAVNWSYNNSNSTVQTTFTVTPDVKEGIGNAVLMGVLPHQWAHLSASSPQPGSYFYTTSRGQMKMMTANSFVVENKFKGVLPVLPKLAQYSAGFDPAALNSKLEQLKGAGLDSWTDSYNEGLAMNRLIQVARVADQTGNLELRDQLVSTVKERLENWLKAESGEKAFLCYYNSVWTTLIGFPAGYSADAHINDHHFHYGYFIQAAAAIEQFQPGWAAAWGGMVNLLVKDAANWERSDLKFPFLRSFHPYAGHSFAAGMLINEPHGNNQESSSEAMNFNAALIHWGQLTGNDAIRDLGIYLYTTEQTAVEEYWFNMSKRNFSSNYGQLMCSRVWSDGYDRGTFWTNDIAAMYGIEMFPMTANSLYLSHNQTYSKLLWNDMKSKTGVLNKVSNDNLWYDIYWSYLAQTDAAAAINLYNAFPNYKSKGGCSDAFTYHWIHTLNGSGPVDAGITADCPFAVVFNKSGDKTYVCQNYGSSELLVHYSDGYTMTVPPRTLKTSKDASISSRLSLSATQVPVNGSATLTATIAGTGTSKVEFYDGTTLVGTLTTAPFTINPTSLAAGVHQYYAKVYSGTAVQFSNVVSLVVGSQLPYGGTPIQVPTQTFESGSYDYFEGGVGQNISYFDANSANNAGSFRSPEYVDAGATANEGNTVGWIEAGEWLEYTVNVEQTGTFEFTFRYSSGSNTGGGPFHLEIDSVPVANNITVPFTGTSWNVWASKTIAGVSLTAGKHVLRVYFDKGGLNLGKMSFAFKSSSPPAPAVSNSSYCQGAAAVALSATPSLGNSLLWYGTNATGGNFSTTAPVPSTTAAGTTDYYVSQVTAGGSESPRAKVTVTVNALPPMPVISFGNNLLSTTASSVSYQWLYNLQPIAGATSASHTPAQGGEYSLRVTDANGCKNSSATLNVTLTAIFSPSSTALDHLARLMPNPVQSQLRVVFNEAPLRSLELQVISMDGVVLKTRATKFASTVFELGDLPAGTYILKVVGKGYDQVQMLLIGH